jgi:Ni/Fe-hydrogenase 1 B-type cytochrome subunit
MTESTHPGRVPEAVAEATKIAGPPQYRWVYLWRWPLRLTHWISAACIVVLAVTGFYIASPFLGTWGEASGHYLMGWARFLHFTAAATIVGAALLRVYWMFAGGKFASWKALLPVRKRDWVNLGKMVKHYLLVHQERMPHYLGHHPLQQLTYTMIYLVACIQILTGFSLYGLSNPGGLISTLFGWVGPVLGGYQYARFLHHALTWVLVTFIPLHVYLAFRADVVDQEGEMSSIFSGGRFVLEGVKFEDE